MEKFYKYPKLIEINNDIFESKKNIGILNDEIKFVKEKIQQNKIAKTHFKFETNDYKKSEIFKLKIEFKNNLKLAKRQKQDIEKIYNDYLNDLNKIKLESSNKISEFFELKEKEISMLNSTHQELLLKKSDLKIKHLNLENLFKKTFSEYGPVIKVSKEKNKEDIKETKKEVKDNIYKFKQQCKRNIKLIHNSDVKRKKQKISSEIVKRNQLITSEKQKISNLYLERAAISESNRTSLFKIVEKAYYWSNNKNSNSKYINTIKDTALTLLPFILVGAVSELFTNVILDLNKGSLMNLFYFTNDQKVLIGSISNLFGYIKEATIGIIGLLVAFICSYKFSRYFDVNRLTIGVLSVIVYIILNSTVISSTFNISDIVSDKGIFSAFVISFIVVKLNEFIGNMTFVKRFRLPNTTQKEIHDSFKIFIPALIIIILAIILAFIFDGFSQKLDLISPVGFPKTGKKNFMELLAWMVEAPIYLVSKANYFSGAILTLSSWSLISWFGINGSSVLNFLFQNDSIYSVKSDSGNWFNNLVNNNFIQSGGAGATFLLIVAILFFSKRSEFRLIAGLSSIFGFFNINEPIIYCLPIIYNVTFLIPLILAPVVGLFIVHFSIIENWMQTPTNVVTWTMPPIFGAALTTNGSVGAIITAIIIMFSQFFVYTPFVLLDNKLYNKFLNHNEKSDATLKERILKDYDKDFFEELM